MVFNTFWKLKVLKFSLFARQAKISRTASECGKGTSAQYIMVFTPL